MNPFDFAQALGQIDPIYLQEALDQMENNTKRNRSKKTMRTVLIAAAITALLCAAVYAVVSGRMNTRDVSDETVSGMWNEQFCTYGDAQLELTFDITAETCYEAEFRPGWLPVEPQYHVTASREGWYTNLSNCGDDPNGEVPYVIYLQNGANLKGLRYILNGKTETVLEDEWRGWKRTELHVDYRDVLPDVPVMQDRYYLLLFSEKDGVFLYIASSQYGFDVLERMAEGLEVEMLPTVAEPLERGGTDIGVIDLGRG